MDTAACDSFVAKLEAQGCLVMRTERFSVFLDRKQYYLGRCFVWANRPDCRDFFVMDDEEWLELRSVTTRMSAAYQASFKPDIVNVAFLGNEAEHLHAHLVPRYRSPPQFEGRDWTDEAWGSNYSQPCARDPQKGGTRKIDFTKEPEDRLLLQKIREELLRGLEATAAAGEEEERGSSTSGSGGVKRRRAGCGEDGAEFCSSDGGREADGASQVPKLSSSSSAIDEQRSSDL